MSRKEAYAVEQVARQHYFRYFSTEQLCCCNLEQPPCYAPLNPSTLSFVALKTQLVCVLYFWIYGEHEHIIHSILIQLFQYSVDERLPWFLIVAASRSGFGVMLVEIKGLNWFYYICLNLTEVSIVCYRWTVQISLLILRLRCEQVTLSHRALSWMAEMCS